MTEKTKTANPLDRASEVFAGILDNLNIVLKGKNEQAELAVTCTRRLRGCGGVVVRPLARRHRTGRYQRVRR